VIAGQRARTVGLRAGLSFGQVSMALVLVVVILSWLWVIGEDRARGVVLLSAESAEHVGRFIGDLLGLDAARTPAYLRPERWAEMAGLAVETLGMSVLAAGIAGAGALVLAVFAARNVAFGSLRPSRSPFWPAAFLSTRGLFTVTRALPELLWALLLLFLLTPGVLPGALALGLHNLGVVGKLGAEVVEDLNVRPIRALQRAGARPGQLLAYGILPSVLPQLLTYLLYRWEVIIRSTIVVGFVGAGGLGQEFRLRMSYFHFTDVTLILLVYLLLVFTVDLVAAGLRRLAR
jgi:phosphonate transport system permease protein